MPGALLGASGTKEKKKCRKKSLCFYTVSPLMCKDEKVEKNVCFIGS